jgi:dihydropyrimidinase
MIDTIIRSNQVVTPQGVGAYDIAISGQTIAAVAAIGALSLAPHTRLIDATNKLVIPGGIDPHVHCAWHIPGPEGKSEMTAAPDVVSRAALFGGTTTLLDFARWTHGNTVQGTIEARDKDWIGRCFTDFAYHVMVEGLFPVGLTNQVAEAIQAGYATVKIFTTDITPSRKGRMVGYGDIWEMFKVLSKNGGLGVIHAEDNDIVMHMYDKLIREGRVGFEHMSEVHNTLSEDLSFRRVIRLAEQMNTAIYMMHVSAGTGVQAIREARSRGKPVYGETLHQYILHTEDDYKLPNGQVFHTYPSLKSKDDTEALWRGVSDNVIHSIATDELCCSLAVKTQGKRIDDTTGGNTGVEPRVSLMYTEMVEKRGYSLMQFVDLISSNAARILGMYPRKGAIAAGSDADLVILDPGLARTIQNKDLHESDYTPWEGHQVGLWPCLTMLRGKIMVEDGKFFGQLSDGQYLKRKIAPEILAGIRL